MLPFISYTEKKTLILWGINFCKFHEDLDYQHN